MKQCKKCGEEKPLVDYNKRQAKCKSCQLAYVKKWKVTNKDRTKQWKEQNHNHLKSYAKKYNKNNKDKLEILNKEWAYKYKGVYGAFENGKCLYIGESTQINQRITNHKHYTKHPENKNKQPNLYYKLTEHKHIIWGIIEQCENHKERERHFIDIYNPVYNNI